MESLAAAAAPASSSDAVAVAALLASAEPNAAPSSSSSDVAAAAIATVAVADAAIESQCRTEICTHSYYSAAGYDMNAPYCEESVSQTWSDYVPMGYYGYYTCYADPSSENAVSQHTACTESYSYSESECEAAKSQCNEKRARAVGARWMDVLTGW